MTKRGARTILVIDDEEDLRVVLSDVLTTAGYQAETAASGLEGLEYLGRSTPDLVVLDLMLPDLSGFEVCKRIKARMKEFLPVIMLTARGDIESMVGGLGEAQADDYVVKPFRPQELLARIGANLRIKDLHDVIRGQNEMLTELSVTDDLTGLYNRRYLTRKLNEKIQALRERAGDLSCALLDLDHFKKINDQQGHLAGDEALRQFAQALKDSVGAWAGGGEIVVSGRWGGDEFLVLGSGAMDEVRIRAWLAGLQSKIQSISTGLATIRLADKPAADLGVSVGAATVQGPDANLNPLQLLADLDVLLYQAKRQAGEKLAVAKFNTIGRSAAAVSGDDGNRPVIFVLEDDPDICSIIQDMLSRHPYETKIFQETARLMEAVGARVPNLILLDLRLADGDGLEVCRNLRARPETSKAKICFLSAFTAEEMREKAKSSGADDFLVKPFSYSKFIERVRRLLRVV